MSGPATMMRVPAIVHWPQKAPLEGEIGYSNRVLVSNGLGSLADVLRRRGWDGPYHRPAFPKRMMGALEKDLGLAASLPRTASRNRLRLGPDSGVNKGLLSLAEVRLCPLCLREAGIVPKAGELVLGSACPLHRKRLVASCPDCGRSFGWPHLRPSQCACGFDLSLCEPEEATPEEVLINAALVGQTETAQPEVFRRIASLPLADRAALIRYAATHLLGRLPRRARLKALPFEAIVSCMREVGAFFVDWPASIPHRTHASGTPLPRTEAFGPAWKAAKDLKWPGARRLLLQGFEAAYGSLNPESSDLRRGRTAARSTRGARFLTLDQAARAAGIRRARLREMIGHSEIRAERLAVGRTWIYRIPVEDVPAIRRIAAGPLRLSLQDIATAWKVSDETARSLYHAAGRLGLSDGTPAEFMAGFNGMLRANLRKRRARRNAELLGFAEAVRRRLRRHGVSLRDLAQAVRDGRIGPVVETSEGGLDAFRFLRTDIDRLVAEGAENARP